MGAISLGVNIIVQYTNNNRDNKDNCMNHQYMETGTEKYVNKESQHLF